MKKTITLYLTKTDRKKLEYIAKQNGCSISELINELLKADIKEKESIIKNKTTRTDND